MRARTSTPTAQQPPAADAFADEESFACVEPLPNIVGDLNPAAPVDYVELREVRWDESPEDGGVSISVSAAASHGDPCATATNKDACTSALGALTLEDPQHERGWFGHGDTILRFGVGAAVKQFVVFTRGDEVGALYTTAELVSFLGEIDTAEEARLVLQSRNQPLVCNPPPPLTRPSKGKSGWRKNADGSWEFLIAGTACGSFVPYRNRHRVARDGTIDTLATDMACSSGEACGRRPEGLQDHVPGGTTDLGKHFARCAWLEAASVIAFRRLELDLLRFGAPERLVARARRSRRDEIRHARETAMLARRFGGEIPPVQVEDADDRTLFAIALENAVEGCVRETYGALVAGFQAERAAPELRPILRRIAEDEARHAELAHDVARWIEPRLSHEERRALADARARALDELRRATRIEPPADVVAYAGMPSSEMAAFLVDRLDVDILRAA